ncbi:MAG: hypothetical protein ABI416_10150, partial [Ginsengibacter sp.]
MRFFSKSKVEKVIGANTFSPGEETKCPITSTYFGNVKPADFRHYQSADPSLIKNLTFRKKIFYNIVFIYIFNY